MITPQEQKGTQMLSLENIVNLDAVLLGKKIYLKHTFQTCGK